MAKKKEVGIGHNRGDEGSGQIGGMAGEALRQFIARIERLNEEKQALQDDIKDVFAQAKSAGFDVKILRKVISLRKMEAQEREVQEQLLDLYWAAIEETLIGDVG
jgi:uncharacterized protein (UPF0335 family)